MSICVSCFGLVVSTCQVIGYRKTPLMTPSWCEEIISTDPGGRACLCVFFFCLVCLCCYFPQPYTIYISKPMAWYSLYVLKVPLSTKQTIQQTHILTKFGTVTRGRVACLRVSYVSTWNLKVEVPLTVFGVTQTSAYSCWHRMTKFGVVTHMRRGLFLGVSHPLHLQKWLCGLSSTTVLLNSHTRNLP